MKNNGPDDMRSQDYLITPGQTNDTILSHHDALLDMDIKTAVSGLQLQTD
jgi:hypothetical protein